jgi:hypothetical protein
MAIFSSMPGTHTVTATWSVDGCTCTVTAKLADSETVARNGTRTTYRGKSYTMIFDVDGETIHEDTKIPARTLAAMERAADLAYGANGHAGVELTY